MNSPIQVIVVEDHSIFRAGLKKVLENIDNVKVIGEAENGAVFLEMLKKKVPDIVLMDIKMPVMDGIEATEKALQLYPDLKVIIRADQNVAYNYISPVLVACAQANIQSVDFAIQNQGEGP